MKIENLAYAVAGETLLVLERKYHYRIPEEHKREIQRTIQDKLNEILAQQEQPEAEADAAEEV